MSLVRIVTMLSLIILPLCQVVDAKDWSHYPGLSAPGNQGIVAADLDGDGVDELVLTGHPNHLALVKRINGESLVRDLWPLTESESIEGRISTVRNGQRDELFLVIRDTWTDSRLFSLTGHDLTHDQGVVVPTGFHLSGLADLDDDGVLEAYGTFFQFIADPPTPMVLDATTGLVEWSGMGFQSKYVAAGQLDGDTPMELILANTSTGHAYVLDGLTYSVEWDWLAGFNGDPVVGNFRGDPAIDEFIVVAQQGLAQLFVSEPIYSPISEGETGIWSGPPQAYDISGDGIEELIGARGGDGEVVAYSISDWSLILSRNGPGGGVYGIAAGEFDGETGADLAWGSGQYDVAPDSLQIGSTSDRVGDF